MLCQRSRYKRQKEHTTIAFHQNPHGHGRSHLGYKLIRSYNINARYERQLCIGGHKLCYICNLTRWNRQKSSLQNYAKYPHPKKKKKKTNK